jgi:hypothetical protein
MNDLELKQLQRIVERLQRNKSMSKVEYQTSNNTYQWGLSDGILIGYEMIKTFYDKMVEASIRSNTELE